jgi:hypothetical protein
MTTLGWREKYPRNRLDQNQNRSKTLPGGLFGLQGELKSESQNGGFGSRIAEAAS